MPRRGKVGFGLLLSLVLNLALAGAVAYFFFGEKLFPKPKPVAVALEPLSSDSPVQALGRVQPAGGLLNVFGPPGDRLAEFTTKLGQTVEGKTKLAKLSGEADRLAQVELLKAQIAEALALKAAIEASRKAKLDDIDAEARVATVGADQDAKALDAKVRAVEAQMKRATAEQRRLKEAQASKLPVSQSEIDQMDALYAQAEGEKEAALAQREKIRSVKAESEQSIVAKKATVEAETKRALAQVPLASLKATLDSATQKLSSGELQAPTNGSVVRYLTKPGDTITTQPVLQFADTSKIIVLAEVYETDIPRVRTWALKGPVTAEIDARILDKEKKLRGKLLDAGKISTVVAKNVLTPLGPREDADRRVIDVEIELDAESAALAKDFLGLQVRVTLNKN